MQHLRIERRFPVLSILALLSAALFFFGSMPIWHRIVWDRINTAEYNSEDAKEDAGRFGSLEVVLRAVMTGVAGAGVGLILAGIAHWRRESFPWVRGVAFVGNLLIIFLAVIHYLFHR